MARKGNGCGGLFIESILQSINVESNSWSTTNEMFEEARPRLEKKNLLRGNTPQATMDSRIREAAGRCSGDNHQFPIPLFEADDTVRPMKFRLTEEGIRIAVKLQESSLLIKDNEESKLVRNVRSSIVATSATQEVADVKTLQWFMENRREQYNAALEIVELARKRNNLQELINRFICLWGPLKWGKREVLDCLSLMLRGEVQLYYVLSLNRREMVTQKDELADYGWNIVECKSECKRGIVIDENDHRPYIIAFDECDYGDGSKQCFDEWYDIISNRQNVVLMGVSATPFTFLYNMDKRFEKAPIVIGRTSGLFVSLGRLQFVVKDETAILPDGTFTDSFRQVITEWAKTDNTQKMKFIVRVKNGVSSSAINHINQQLGDIWNKERGDRSVTSKFVDMNLNDNLFWKKVYKDEKGEYQDNLDAWKSEGNQLIIVKQCFTRGTETNIHPFLYGYYDVRTESTPANTILQANGRLPNYKGIDDIKVYISFEHKTWLDAYLDMEAGIAEGKNFSHYVEKYKHIQWTGKLKPSKKGLKARDKEYRLDMFPFHSENEAQSFAKSKSNHPDFIDWMAHKEYEEKDVFGTCTVSKNEGKDSDILTRMLGGNLGHAGDGRLIHYVDAASPTYDSSWKRMIKERPEWEGKYVVAIPRRSSDSERRVQVPLNDTSLYSKHMKKNNIIVL